ncbi:MAG: hypothetical protein ABGZ17_02295 [Planctomycetaceae bacterium]
MGYRGAAPFPNEEADEFRICFLGGSTVVNGTPPIGELVANLFAERNYPRVRVYNFGGVSSVSPMELVKIVTEISSYRPDMIVMYNDGNDFLTPFSRDPRPGYPFNFLVCENHQLA